MKDKKRFIIFLIFGVILLILVPVAARSVREIIEVYNFKINKLPNNYLVSLLKDKVTYKSFFDFKNPVNAIGLVGIGWYVLSYFIGSLGLFKINSTYEQTESYGSHGTSRWQTKNEIKDDYYNDKVGWFIGSLKKGQTYSIGMEAAYHAVNNKSKLNMQILVIGPPGCNKTTGFVLPNIFSLVNSYKEKNLSIDRFLKKRAYIESKYGKVPSVMFNFMHKNFDVNKEMPDLIITDPKPELYLYTADYLKNNNYDVKVLDFIDLKYGDTLNSLDFIDDDKTLMEIAQGYVDSVSGAASSNSGDQQFWNDQEAQVLAALMGFVKQRYDKDKQNFTEILKLLTSDNVSDIDNAAMFFKMNNITGAAEQLWNNFLMLADTERTRANILGGLAEKLKLFSIKGVQDLTSSTTFDISKLGAKKNKPMAVFILMPDGDRTFSPIINVCITSMLKQMYKTARKTRARLENPVFMILEEMANIGKIPDIQTMLGTMRGRRIYPMMIWQSLPQMKDRYGDKGYEDIMSQCDSVVYLGMNDTFTQKYCSDDLGNTTIKIQGVSQKANTGILSINDKSETQNFQQRKLLLPEECKKFDNNKLIFIQRSKEPVNLYKVQYQYWKYQLCNILDVYDLQNIGDISTNNNVDNITHIDERDFNLVHNKDIDYNNPGNVKEVSSVIPDVNPHESSIDTAEIDVNALKCFTEKKDDFDIDM